MIAMFAQPLRLSFIAAVSHLADGWLQASGQLREFGSHQNSGNRSDGAASSTVFARVAVADAE